MSVNAAPFVMRPGGASRDAVIDTALQASATEVMAIVAAAKVTLPGSTA